MHEPNSNEQPDHPAVLPPPPPGHQEATKAGDTGQGWLVRRGERRRGRGPLTLEDFAKIMGVPYHPRPGSGA